MNRSITVMGGTFNPIHKGHIAIAVAAHDQFNLGDILVMPSGHPAHKDNSELIDAVHRCNMVMLAIQDYPYMHLSTMEVERQGNTYTAETLRILHNDYNEIYFIIGADSLFAIPSWVKPEYICTHCHLLVANRDRTPDFRLLEQKCRLEDEFYATIDFITCDNYPYSSTQIRKAVRAGKNILNAVDIRVAEYIKEHGIYI